MIAQAEIIDLDPTTNYCSVRIPFFEGAGNLAQVKIKATIALPPGIHSGYKTGDKVFVGFSENSVGKPVVLGHIFKGAIADYAAQDRAGFIDCDKLECETEAKLPYSTTFLAAPNEYSSLEKFANKITELSNEIKDLKERCTNLEERCTNLEDTCTELATRCTGLEGRCSTLDSKCNTLEGKCSTLEDKVAELELWHSIIH